MPKTPDLRPKEGTKRAGHGQGVMLEAKKATFAAGSISEDEKGNADGGEVVYDFLK